MESNASLILFMARHLDFSLFTFNFSFLIALLRLLFVLHLENTTLTPNNNIPNKTIAKIINK